MERPFFSMGTSVRQFLRFRGLANRESTRIHTNEVDDVAAAATTTMEFNSQAPDHQFLCATDGGVGAGSDMYVGMGSGMYATDYQLQQQPAEPTTATPAAAAAGAATQDLFDLNESIDSNDAAGETKKYGRVYKGGPSTFAAKETPLMSSYGESTRVIFGLETLDDTLPFSDAELTIFHVNIIRTIHSQAWSTVAATPSCVSARRSNSVPNFKSKKDTCRCQIRNFPNITRKPTTTASRCF